MNIKIDEYTKQARIYPTIVAMLLPAIITFAMGWPIFNTISNGIKIIENIIAIFIPVALVYGAIGFFFWNISQALSKMIIQQPMFKQDETDMPTTRFLLWENKELSKQYKKEIHNKVQARYGLKLFTPALEKKDLPEAKRVIVDSVRHMREDTRNHVMLLRYNIKYGFLRNYLGGSIFALLITLLLWAINHWVDTLISPFWFYYGIGAHIILFFIICWCLKTSAKDYAKELFIAFMKL